MEVDMYTAHERITTLVPVAPMLRLPAPQTEDACARNLSLAAKENVDMSQMPAVMEHLARVDASPASLNNRCLSSSVALDVQVFETSPVFRIPCCAGLAGSGNNLPIPSFRKSCKLCSKRAVRADVSFRAVTSRRGVNIH
jgi:hypothetical protein